MRLLQSLKSELTSLLQTSPTWRRLLRGLLGQELLAWGASVVYLDDLAYDSLTRDLHPSSASDLGLSLLSASYSIPFQSFTPGVMLYKVVAPNVRKPYSLTQKFNATSWFNIGPVLPSASPQYVELLQGVPLAMVSEGVSFQSTYDNISEVLEVRSMDIFMDEDRSFFYVKLRGDNIVPESVRVQEIEVSGGVTRVKFMTKNEFSSDSYFSIYSLPDGTQAVRFHKSIPDFYQITYFSASLSIPDPLEESVLQDPIMQITNPSGSYLSKRSDFIKSMSEFSAISTTHQVEAFCKASGVVDARAVRNKTISGYPSVSVFFIPPAGGSAVSSFYRDSLSEALGLYGSFSYFNVFVGTEVSFQVKVSSYSALVDFSSLADVIGQYFSEVSPESFSRDLSEALTVYLHRNGFSDIQTSFVLRVPYLKTSLISNFSGVKLNYKFYVGGALDRWSSGSQIIGVYPSAFNFSQSDKIFAMSNAVLVQRGAVGADPKFYIFNKDTGVGSTLLLQKFNILAAGGDTILLSTPETSLTYALNLESEDQVYACSTGVLPPLLSIQLPAIGTSSLSVFDDGYFGITNMSTSLLYRAFSTSILSLGSAPQLLFVYKGKFYFRSTNSAVLLRKDDLNSSTYTEISLKIYGAMSNAGFIGGKISIKDDIFTVVRASDNLTFMFSAVFDNNFFILTSFSGVVYDDFTTWVRLSTYPVSWVSNKLCYLEDDVWVPFSKPLFSVKVGAILSDGSPSFDLPYTYDYLTIETPSIKPFVAELDATYFRLNSQTPVIEQS